MNTIFDFIRAAAPWTALFFATVVLIVRGVIKKKKRTQPNGDYGMEGMCLGMCFGLLTGTMLENYSGIGISLGMLVGLTVGTLIPKKNGERG